MPILSTPASPSPLTEDADHLLVELREFLTNVSVTNPSPRSSPHRHAKTALRLLRHLPVAKDAVLDYFSGLIDMALITNLDPQQSNYSSSSVDDLSMAIEELRGLIGELLATNGPAWAPLISQWSLSLLGEESSKHSGLITKRFHEDAKIATNARQDQPGILELLPVWLNIDVTKMLTDLAVQCISTLRKEDASQTDKCVSALLEASVLHGPDFDWVVAHVGGCFPDTVISRVLEVGLQEFVKYGNTQKTQIGKDGSVNLSKVPKINSVIGILGHLGSTHNNEVRISIQKMVHDSLVDDDEDITDEIRELHVGTIPYFLFLSSLSEVITSSLMVDILHYMNLDVALQIEAMISDWIDLYFPGPGSLLTTVVDLIQKCGGAIGRDLWQLLFEFVGDSGDKRDSSIKQITSGCRSIMDTLLADLLEIVHQSKPGEGISPIVEACQGNNNFFISNYLLGKDPSRRKYMLTLSHIMSISGGRPVAIKTLKFLVENSETDEDLGTLLIFVRDIELWIPDTVEESLKLAIRSPLKIAQVLDNLGKILHHQVEMEKTQEPQTPSGQESYRISSKFTLPVTKHLSQIIPCLAKFELIPKVLKILHFIRFPQDSVRPSLLHNSSQSLVLAVFILIERRSEIKDQQRLILAVQQCTSVLSQLASRPEGLNMILRNFIEGAIKTKFAKLFGGKYRSPKPIIKALSLYEENLKFGSMPTQPLGASTVFHAGIIGDGKRGVEPENPLSKEDFDTNTFILVSVIFKLCHCSEKQKDLPSRTADYLKQEMSKEACRQLALLLVDLVSPDVMYNGLPWPEEDFARVTVERDLKISKTLADHPILWKLLWGIAEARPALCYCSVILRAALAVQMYHWQSSLCATAAESPQHLHTTKKILQLMSIGQFIPPPLDGVSEIIHILHPFHLHCILVDIWNYVRDNVPSPAPFSCNSGILQREFEPYKNYKQYCERLRLILLKHIGKVPKEFSRFFVEPALSDIPIQN